MPRSSLNGSPTLSTPSMAETARTHVYRHLVDYAVEDQILDELLTTPGLTVLDVGTGATGRSALNAVERGAIVTSIEINPQAIAEFGPRAGIGLAAADLLALPLVEGTFDVVQIALHGFDYLLSADDRARALSEIRRILRPGGALVFNGFNPVGLGLSPSGFRSWPMFRARLRYVGSGRFLRSTRIDDNGLELCHAQQRISIPKVRCGRAGNSLRSNNPTRCSSAAPKVH